MDIKTLMKRNNKGHFWCTRKKSDLEKIIRDAEAKGEDCVTRSSNPKGTPGPRNTVTVTLLKSILAQVNGEDVANPEMKAVDASFTRSSFSADVDRSADDFDASIPRRESVSCSEPSKQGVQSAGGRKRKITTALEIPNSKKQKGSSIDKTFSAEYYSSVSAAKELETVYSNEADFERARNLLKQRNEEAEKMRARETKKRNEDEKERVAAAAEEKALITEATSIRATSLGRSDGDQDVEGSEQDKEFVTEEDRKMMSCTTFHDGRPDILTDDQKAKINRMEAPRHVYHVQSKKGFRHTAGSASNNSIKPAAATVKGQFVYPDIKSFSRLSELIVNFGFRILWMIRNSDQFFSSTTSLIFAFVHATGREVRGEEEIFIVAIDTQDAKRIVPNDKQDAKTTDANRAKFYYVPKLMSILGVLEFKGWVPKLFDKLRSPRYTHEYVAHGKVDIKNNRYRMVPLEEFRQLGLHHLAPGLLYLPGVYDRAEHKRQTKLWHRQQELKANLFAAEETTCTTEDLDIAADQARLFDRRAEGIDKTTKEGLKQLRQLPVNFSFFADFVSFRRRPKTDPVFQEYVKNHFQVQDVPRLTPVMSCIPNNLPESMGAHDRHRDACIVLGAPLPPRRTTRLVDANFDYEGIRVGDLKRIMAPHTVSTRLENALARLVPKATSQAQEDVSAADEAEELEDEDQPIAEGDLVMPMEI